MTWIATSAPRGEPQPTWSGQKTRRAWSLACVVLGRVIEALRGEAAQDFANGDGTHTTVILIRGEKFSPSKMLAKTLMDGTLRREQSNASKFFNYCGFASWREGIK